MSDLCASESTAKRPTDRLTDMVRERAEASSDFLLREAALALCEAYEKTVELLDGLCEAVEEVRG